MGPAADVVDDVCCIPRVGPRQPHQLKNRPAIDDGGIIELAGLGRDVGRLGRVNIGRSQHRRE